MIELLVAVALAQQPDLPKNPRAWTFECLEHAADTRHVVGIYALASGDVPVDTFEIGDPELTPAGKVEFTISVSTMQQLKFGKYYLRVRSAGPDWSSPWSVASDDWERTPGAPGKPVPIPGQE